MYMRIYIYTHTHPVIVHRGWKSMRENVLSNETKPDLFIF